MVSDQYMVSTNTQVPGIGIGIRKGKKSNLNMSSCDRGCHGDRLSKTS